MLSICPTATINPFIRRERSPPWHAARHGAGRAVWCGGPACGGAWGGPGNRGCSPQTVTKTDFPCTACVLRHVVLNNSREEAPNAPLETSGFPGRSPGEMPSQSFGGMRRPCPRSLLNVSAPTPRSRYVPQETSAVWGTLRAHHRKAEPCGSRGAGGPEPCAAAAAAVGMPSSHAGDISPATENGAADTYPGFSPALFFPPP